MGSREQGMKLKYEVHRLDGRPILDGCMVMEWTDKHGRAAIKAFSQSVRADGYHKLADELDEKLKTYEPSPVTDTQQSAEITQ